jgi:hypothetical protein
LGNTFFGVEGGQYTPTKLEEFTKGVKQPLFIASKIESKQFRVTINLGITDLALAKDYLTGIITQNIEYVMTNPELDDNDNIVFEISAPGFSTNEEEIRKMIKEFTTTYQLKGKVLEDEDLTVKEIKESSSTRVAEVAEHSEQETMSSPG